MRWLPRSLLLALLLAAAPARSASLEIRAAGPDGAPVSVSRAEVLLVAYGDVRTVPLPAAGSRVVADLSSDWLEEHWPERAADVSKAYFYLEAGELAPLRSEAFDWLGVCAAGARGRAHGSCARRSEARGGGDAVASSTTSNDGDTRNPRALRELRQRRPGCCVVAPQRCYGIACVANALHPNLRCSQRGHAVLPRRLLGTPGGDGEPVARTAVRFPRSAPVAVEPGADASVAVAFRHREPRRLRLEDAQGRPLAGVTVRAFLFFSRANHCGEIVRTFDLLGESGTGERTTDSAGRVRIPDGDFEVALLFEDLHLHALEHPDALPWPTPRLVTRLTEEETVLRFERFAARDVDLVVTRGGEPLAGAVLTGRVAHCPCGACWGSLGTSDARGVVRLRDFHPRRYDRVELRPAGRPFGEPALWSGDPRAWGPEPVLRVELPSPETP